MCQWITFSWTRTKRKKCRSSLTSSFKIVDCRTNPSNSIETRFYALPDPNATQMHEGWCLSRSNLTAIHSAQMTRECWAAQFSSPVSKMATSWQLWKVALTLPCFATVREVLPKRWARENGCVEIGTKQNIFLISGASMKICQVGNAVLPFSVSIHLSLSIWQGVWSTLIRLWRSSACHFWDEKSWECTSHDVVWLSLWN